MSDRPGTPGHPGSPGSSGSHAGFALPATAGEVAAAVGGVVEAGPADRRIAGLGMLHEAGPECLSFVASPAWAARFASSRVGAVMIGRRIQLPERPDAGEAAVIRVADADLGMARLLGALAPEEPRPPAGVHATAAVDPTAELGEGVRVGAGSTVGARARLGAGCVLHAGVHVYPDAELGPGCVLWPGVVVRERCVAGARLLAHTNAVIGTDGFGFRGDVGDDGQPFVRKVPHLGNVIIGDDVELGAGTCVDKAKFGSTRIGDHTKLDNQVQVGHNVVIGSLVVISGNTSVAGSVVIGDGVMIGGHTALADHVTIGAGAKLAGGSQVMQDVPPGAEWGGIPAQHFKDRIRQEVAVRRLPELLRKLKRSGVEV